ncbi:MAG: matrixin family metalloprotease [Arachnia propionica]|nr:matrixin family metalloprotease [Arachnia propionica]
MLRRTTRLLILAVTTAAILSTGSPASHGYTATGCRWGTKSPTISTRNVHGKYSTAFYSAQSNINARTPVTLNTTADGALWWAWNGNYGSSGWEGLSSWGCRSGKVTGGNSRVNNTYLAGAPSGQIKVVWLHELSHVFGLGHVNSKKRVMYTSASEAYKNGVRSLTSDEIAGYRHLY